jgi:hypothetical protein
MVVGVGVGVVVGVRVFVGVTVGVRVFVGVTVGVRVFVGVLVGVSVRVFVGVNVGVTLGEGGGSKQSCLPLTNCNEPFTVCCGNVVLAALSHTQTN